MAKTTARVVRFHELGGPDVLKIEEIPSPEPGKGEVRLRVEAIGLNRAEVMFRMGQYLEQPHLPAKNGYEASGVVDAVGPDVERRWLGKKVSTIPAFSLNQYGVYGDTAIVPVHAIAAYPEKLTPAEGTAIWMQYLTAYGALVMHGRIQRGDFVVLTAASSSVGLAAIERQPTEERRSIRRLIELQRRLMASNNPFQRCVGTLLAAGVLDRHLDALSDRQVGQLMFDEVGNDLGIAQPEATICHQATRRLFRSEGGRLEEEPLLRSPCPRCGNEMLPHYGIDEPVFYQCVYLACGHKEYVGSDER